MNDLYPAEFGWRGLAYIIDTVILFLTCSMIMFGIEVLLTLTSMSLGLYKQPLHIESTPSGFIIKLLSSWLYFAFLESSAWQATLGKKIFKLTVTDSYGARISFLRATSRYWAKMFVTSVSFLAFRKAWHLLKRNQALHDLITATLVLKP